MKYHHSPLFYLGLIAIVFSPLAGWGIFVLLASGIIFLLLDLVIRKLSMPLWARLVVQGLVVLNWLFWGMRAIVSLMEWVGRSFF